MTITSYQLDMYAVGKTLQNEIAMFLRSGTSPVAAQSLFPAYEPPKLIECVGLAMEVFQATLESRLHWHHSKGDRWPAITHAMRWFGEEFAQNEWFDMFEDDILLPSLYEWVDSVVEQLVRGKRWHRFDVLRPDVRPHANPRYRAGVTVLRIEDLGDHRILHYHETVDAVNEERADSSDDPEVINAATLSEHKSMGIIAVEGNVAEVGYATLSSRPA